MAGDKVLLLDESLRLRRRRPLDGHLRHFAAPEQGSPWRMDVRPDCGGDVRADQGIEAFLEPRQLLAGLGDPFPVFLLLPLEEAHDVEGRHRESPLGYRSPMKKKVAASARRRLLGGTKVQGFSVIFSAIQKR